MRPFRIRKKSTNISQFYRYYISSTDELLSNEVQECLKTHPIIAIDYNARKEDFLLFSRPEDILILLKTEADSFEKEVDALNLILGNGNLIYSNGEQWSSQHERLKHIFSPRTFSFRMQVMNDETIQWVDNLLEKSKKRVQINLYQELHILSLKIIFKLIFEKPITDDFINKFLLLRQQLFFLVQVYYRITYSSPHFFVKNARFLLYYLNLKHTLLKMKTLITQQINNIDFLKLTPCLQTLFDPGTDIKQLNSKVFFTQIKTLLLAGTETMHISLLRTLEIAHSNDEAYDLLRQELKIFSPAARHGRLKAEARSPR